LDDDLALFFLISNSIGNVCYFAANEVGSFIQKTPVELFIALARRTHVDVAVVNLGIGQSFMDQMRELQGVHAAYLGAVLMIILISGSNTMDDSHSFWLGLQIAKHDLAIGWTGGVNHAFKL